MNNMGGESCWSTRNVCIPEHTPNGRLKSRGLASLMCRHRSVQTDIGVGAGHQGSDRLVTLDTSWSAERLGDFRKVGKKIQPYWADFLFGSYENCETSQSGCQGCQGVKGLLVGATLGLGWLGLASWICGVDLILFDMIFLHSSNLWC